MVDVEADCPCPGRYSMLSFGAILVKPGLVSTFHGRLRPVSDAFVPDALAVSGLSRAEIPSPSQPHGVMQEFASRNTPDYYGCKMSARAA
jgi:hypothetical protein